jgi:hypothetical protein
MHRRGIAIRDRLIVAIVGRAIDFGVKRRISVEQQRGRKEGQQLRAREGRYAPMTKLLNTLENPVRG